MSYDEFDRLISRRYFDSDRCHEPTLRGKILLEAARSLWEVKANGADSPPSEFDAGRFPGKLAECLAQGRLTYVTISTRVTERVRRVLRYLTTTSTFRAFALEVSHFADGDLSVFVPTAVAFGRDGGGPGRRDRAEFLAALTPHGRDIFEGILGYCEATNETVYWGTVGFSFRPEFNGKAASVLYGFPARKAGGPDLLQVYFPHLEWADVAPEVIARYRTATEQLPGFQYTKARKTGNIPLAEQFTQQHVNKLAAALDELLGSRHDTGEGPAE
jgi:hypothetical protein